jgi:GT2 family glycosyltransferase
MLITVVIPTYNRCTVLAQCLSSLFSQTCGPQGFEIVVVIDGGTDKTRDYLRTVKFPCASQIIEQENRGQAAARNAGIRVARSKYILILDDDFICEPGLIQQHLDAHDGSASVVVGPISHNDAAAPSIPALAIDREIRPYYQRLENGTPQIPWLPPNGSVSRDLLLSLGGYDECFSSAREDTDLGIRLANAGVKFRYAPDAVVRQHYDKSADQLVSTAALFGKHDVMLARKSASYGAQSNLSRLNSGAKWKRSARRIVATLPFALEPLLYPLYAVSASLPQIPFMREAAIRLLNLRRYIVWVRAAVREAGGWTSLLLLTAQTTRNSRAAK